MNKLIIDVEATCAIDGSITFEDSEIIEIGAVFVSSEGYFLDTFERFVKPYKNKTLTKFCKRLTNIKQSDINSADFLDVVLVDLYEVIKHNFGDEEFEYCSWSDFDKIIMKRQIESINKKRKKKIALDLTTNFVDLQREFGRKHKSGKKRIGLVNALKHLNMEFIGSQHRAIDDAINTARVAMYGEDNLCTA